MPISTLLPVTSSSVSDQQIPVISEARTPSGLLPGHDPGRGHQPSLSTPRKPDGSINAGWYLVPLRVFLGVTFVFASLQKLANPNFFRSTSPISIHAQLLGATHSSPIHSLISPLVSAATVVGVLIAVGELAVGVGTLLGLFSRVAATGGLLINLSLFLTVSYHSSPYFTGSDIVFFFAWTPFILAGAAGAPALDTWLASRRRSAGATALAPAGVVSRRSVVSLGTISAAVAAGVVVLGGAAVALGRAVGGAAAPSSGERELTSASLPTTTGTGTASKASSTPKGTVVGTASSVPVGGSAAFTDPQDRRPLPRHPADSRRLRRLRRHLPACRLHGRLSGRVADHRLPVPRLRVQPEQR